MARNADNGLVTEDLNSLFRQNQGFPEDFGIFANFRLETVPAGRVLAGRLRAELTPDSPEVREYLGRWPGYAGQREGPQGWELFLVEPTVRRERWWLHGVLLALTLFSTVVAGSLLAGQTPILFTGLHLFDEWWLPVPLMVDFRALVPGLPFGLALVTVLAVHEAGHYFTARHHRISVTPPFFIPFPPYISIIGTLGAFIRLRSPVLTRPVLLDVGVAGPLLSFAASLPLLWWGLLRSQVVLVLAEMPSRYMVHFAGQEQFWLGGSLVLKGMARLTLGVSGTGELLILHPLAFAGWLGLFVTALNLLPISQLDGGHILYALLGSRQRPLAWVFFALLIPLGLLWAGWWVWATLVFAIGRGRVQHPPLFNDQESPRGRRLWLGLAAGLMFALSFVPIPFLL
ncbi:MAG: site-2 protease family protein [Gemmatimonadota bacterium]|nr:MAG: site-2 protease family protein [Gemmatimonadota bacterium]